MSSPVSSHHRLILAEESLEARCRPGSPVATGSGLDDFCEKGAGVEVLDDLMLSTASKVHQTPRRRPPARERRFYDRYLDRVNSRPQGSLSRMSRAAPVLMPGHIC